MLQAHPQVTRRISMKRLLPIIIMVFAVCPMILPSGAMGQEKTAAAQSPGQAAAAASQPSAPGNKKEADCGCDIKIPSDTLAVVNGIKVSTKEIDDSINEQVKGMQNQVVEARKRELDLQINTK